jgi:hypothetical protein
MPIRRRSATTVTLMPCWVRFRAEDRFGLRLGTDHRVFANAQTSATAGASICCTAARASHTPV